MKALLIMLLVSIVSVFTAQAQETSCCEGLSTEPTGDYELLSETGSVELAFDLEDNQILLPVKFNGQGPFRLILDTGMPLDGALLFDSPRARELGLEFTGKLMTGGCGSCEETPPNLAMDVTLALPGVVVREQMVSVLPVGDTLGDDLAAEGVIGLGLFDRFVVTVDFDRQRVTLTEPDQYDYQGDGLILSAPQNTEGIPVLDCAVTLENGRKVPIQAIVDSGAGHALSLSVGNPEGIVLPKKAEKTTLGKSLYGEIIGHRGRIRSLHIGPHTLNSVVTSFVASNGSPLPDCIDASSNLGLDALRRFNVVFDYARERIILEPNRSFDDPFAFKD